MPSKLIDPVLLLAPWPIDPLGPGAPIAPPSGSPQASRLETPASGRTGTRPGTSMTLRVPGVLILGLAMTLASVWPPAAQARTLPAGRNGVSAMVARVLPAVVSINIRRIEYDQFNEPVPKAGMGSGVIVDRRGYILTNNHVVEGAEVIKVTLPNERAFRAILVGGDPFTDLAVLKIEGKNLPVASLGDSTRLAVGETVAAIGSPLWIEGGPSVTVGVVSGLGRSMEEPGLPTLHNLIQTDAAINPGNSGGPLLNLAGQIVGINTALIPSAHGIGFAISVNNAKPVMKALITNGGLARPSLGLTAVSVTPQLAFVNDLPVERGVLVVRVEPGGAAEEVGMRSGDVITAVWGRIVKDLHHLHGFLLGHKAGTPVEVTLNRDGGTLTVRPVLREER